MSLYESPVWEEPPMKARKRRYEEVLHPLMEHPGEWARIGEYASPDSAYQASLSLRKREYRIPEPDHKWEFLHHGSYVWARYIGEA